MAAFPPQMLPTELLQSILESKRAVPFPTIVEVLGLLAAFELLQEASVSLPQSVGQSLSIIGGLVVGSAAVEARLISPAALIVVAAAGICGFAIPGRSFADALRVWRMALAAAAAVASRLMLYALAYAFYRKGGGADSFADSFEALWTHWDVRHYLGIARDGYTNVGDARLRLVFFPLYPAVTRVFSAFTGGNLFAAGTLVSLLCSGLCAALLYDLAAMHLDGHGARLAVAYFLLSPMSVFLACVYTEALFISLTLAAVCLLRRGHPWGAALCGMASALTRMPGVIVSGLFIIAFLARIPREGLRMKAVLRCLAQVGVVFGGLFIYWGINWLVTGDPMTYLIYQKENWYQQPGSFWASTANTVSYLISTCGDDDWLFTWGFQLLAMGYIYILLAARQKKLPFDLAAYSFVYVAVVLSPTWLLSGARYLYALATLPILQAQSLKSRAAHAVGLSVCAALLVVFTWGYTIAAAVL